MIITISYKVIGIAKYNRNFWRRYSLFSTIEEDDGYKLSLYAAFTPTACGALKNAFYVFLCASNWWCTHQTSVTHAVATGRRFLFFGVFAVYYRSFTFYNRKRLGTKSQSGANLALDHTCQNLGLGARSGPMGNYIQPSR